MSCTGHPAHAGLWSGGAPSPPGEHAAVSLETSGLRPDGKTGPPNGTFR